MLLPRPVDGAPRVLAERVVGLEHETARLRDAHRTGLVADHHLAGESARELVVEAAPSVDPVLREPRREGLLLDAEQLVPALSRVLDGEPGGGGRLVREPRLDHLFRCPVQELREGLGKLREALAERLQTPAERQRTGHRRCPR